MKVLVLGGTRFFGVHLVNALLRAGHTVTVATRGNKTVEFIAPVEQITVNRVDPESMNAAFQGREYDLVYDNLAYCSNDVRYLFDAVKAERYIFISTNAVYDAAWDLKEEDFDPLAEAAVWCDRSFAPYNEIKKQAERALFQHYGNRNFTAVRFPFGIGEDDYTGRLQRYVDHFLSDDALLIDNLTSVMSFIRSDEAGEFLAFLAGHPCQGAINAQSRGSISLEEIFRYLKEKTGKEFPDSTSGEAAPYNGWPSYSLNTKKAEELGFSFLPLDDYIYSLVDYYVRLHEKN